MSEPTSRLASQPVCVLTGGTSGIGLETAKRFAKEGYRIVTCGRERVRLEKACREITAAAGGAGVVGVEFDLSNAAGAGLLIDRAVAEFGGIDVLIHCAAVAPLKALEDFSDEELESAVDVNVRALFYLTRAAWRVMIRQGRGGKIVNVSSLSAVDPFPGLSVYGACKAWSDLFGVAIAQEGKSRGIQVFSIRPGAVETPMLRGLFPDFPADQALAPQDVAELIWAVCQDSFRDCGGFPIAIRR